MSLFRTINPRHPSERSVLLVGNFVSAKQYGCVCGAMARELSGAGWNVVCTSHQTTPLRRLWDILAVAWRRRGVYRTAHIDVFSGRAFVWAEMVCAILRLLRKPYVLTLRGGNLPEFLKRSPARGRRLLRSAVAVTAPSAFLQQQLSAYRDGIITIPNPIELDRYRFEPRESPRPRLVWLRAFEGLYNPELAVRALELLKPHFPDATLLMIGRDKGDGSLAAVRRLVENLNLVSSVEIIPGVPKPDVPAQLRRGDIFLNTTNVDNTPVSVIEAMACGLCVVSTNAGGLPYLLTHQHDALLVPCNDAAAFAEAVRRLLGDPALAARLSRNARRKAEASDWHALLPRWERLLSAGPAGRSMKGVLVNESSH